MADTKGKYMEYVRLGHSGMKVSRIAFGCLTLGREADEKESIRMVDLAFDHGINLFDTADFYSKGRSEEVLGKALKEKRDQVVLATKVCKPIREGPNDQGCSRYHLIRAVEDSLRRLKTDRIDLCQLHRFDPETPLEETLRALDDLVRWGKVVYIGCSNFAARELMKALGISRSLGLHSFISIQPLYNILKREVETEIFPLCLEEGIGVIPYNPLAGGFLTGKYNCDIPPPMGTRLGESDIYRERYLSKESFEKTSRFLEVAKKRGLHPIALAMAWVASHPAVTSPVIGARNEEQLKETLKLTELRISIQERDEVSKEMWD
ncbi:MAG: aldo/keto reductase [Thermodesulfobacteriota bacterium]|nr:aldo/keto reductase [Thermodesulfobacteriota bacterium]